MKQLIYVMVLIGMLTSCGSTSSSKKSKNNKNTTNISTPAKSTSTEKIVITNNDNFTVTFQDKGFYDWLQKQPSKNKFLRSTLEIANLQYVTEWNRRVDLPDQYDKNLYTQKIHYKIYPKKHYGLDTNYELYMYFKFFEQKHENLLSQN